MKMFRLFLISLFLFSCGGQDSSSSKKENKNLTAEEVTVGKSLVRRTDEILLDMQERRILNSVTPSEAQLVRGSLSRIKNGLIRLMNGENPKDVFKILKAYLRRLEETKLMFVDAIRLFDYKSDLYSYLNTIANRYNIDLDRLDWVLYDHRFSRLSPFTTTSTAGNWIVDWSLGASYTRVRGSGNKAWLISPLMNFKGIKNPRLKIHHMTMIDADKRSEKPFNRNKILEKTFKALVSTNYIEGEPEKATWREVKLTGFPRGLDFDSVWSDEIPLGEIDADNVSVALLYDMDDKIHGRHYVSWQVNKFLIIGQSENFSTRERPVFRDVEGVEPFYDYQFKNGLGEFTMEKSSETSVNFKPRENRGRKYVEASGFPEKNDGITKLISPIITLSEKKSYIKVTHAINFLKGEAVEQKYLQIYLIEPSNPEKKIELEFTQGPSGSSWDEEDSEWLLLSPSLTGKEVQVVFQYRSSVEKDLFPAWNLHRLRIGEK